MAQKWESFLPESHFWWIVSQKSGPQAFKVGNWESQIGHIWNC